ncbi:MAG: argininosuccinate lyase [Acidimicrobiaceae bacterium]|nr:argininosuccinate lyase [Acidimicrobiaceae bacterium]
MTLWSGRMGVEPAEVMMAFSASLDVDRRLAGDDVQASMAHVRGLGRSGILPEAEVDVLLAALGTVDEELSSGNFAFGAQDEDVHTAIERRVTEIAGDTGARLHTGRSRNDQVATALRLYTRRELAALARAVLGLQATLLDRARGVGEARLPGYTHLQRAQPVLLAHHLLAHGWALGRDVDRIADALARLDVSPLGAGALAGSSLPLDPDGTAADLGFARRFENSMDAVSDRDFVAESLFVCALLGVHLSRLGEEIVLFSSDEFGFYRLDDAWATGSSMLPQKKNPDVAELARGKAGRLVGHLAGFLTTLKGLPLSYNRDLQEDKEPLFDALDQVSLACRAIDGLVSSLVFELDTMRAAADAPVLAAVDLAEWLVERGTPFRQAHGIVGSLVRASLAGGAPLVELVTASPELGPEAAELLAPGAASARRRTPGGAGSAAVAVQLDRYAARLASDEARLAGIPAHNT